ncbi:hypothetical protein DSM43276_03462 [Mycobacteroides salmoniphilum]|uniref:Uncharacterized protein n=1 Tax=Mycobacteroides salmoniphilum TaxID=404941 RepID=A0A4R8SXV3_9MYCO|nr:hypothetical protein DSM43276_03462 [Mycobacteroides salmoniphilum]TEA08170.1 hypothetical protein CCUG60884_00651 [Mycobacteroides salmoniphilum]
MDSTDQPPSSGVPRPEPRASIDMTNRARTLRVKVSEFGLPLEVQVEPDLLNRGASALAREILNLCELGAARCGAARREELAETGIPDYILDKLGLATPAQVADLELRQSDDQMERRS